MWTFRSIQLVLTCDPQHVFAFAPYCTLLKVHTQGVNFSQHIYTIFILVAFFFLEYLFQISRFLGFVGSHTLYYYWKHSLMVGLPNKRDRKLISVGMSAWDLGKRFSKVPVVIQDYVSFLSRSLMNSHCYSVNTEHSRTLLFSLCMYMKSFIMKYVWKLIIQVTFISCEFVRYLKLKRRQINMR